jgi:hypothetical protein
MSSTVTVSATTLHSILARLEQVELTNTALKNEVKALLGVSSSAPIATTVAAPTAPTTAAKAPAKKRGPSRWNRYVSYLTETLTAADPEYKKTPFAERVEQAKSLKDDAEEGMGPTNLAFEAWLAAHPIAPASDATDGSSSDSGVASSTSSDAAKKRGRPKGTKMTDEQKAKAAATRAANKAAKAAATGGAGAPAEEEADLTPFVVGTTTYYRIASGHSWVTSGDEMVYVGLYSEATKTFDKSVADPTA